MKGIQLTLRPLPCNYQAYMGDLLEEAQRAALVYALRKHGGNMQETSEALDMGLSTLYGKVSEFGITDEERFGK